MKLAVIDVETTGLNPNENRMTEIGIVLMEDGVVTGRFESLVNPEVHIPDHVQRLTGIRDAMVKKQPLFSDIAALVNDMTGECIIVGHNVNFDYSFLKNEMKLAGIAFSRKTLCTIELTKYLYPDLNSYSLSALCRKFKIDNRNPHRALPDAEVTAALVLKLLDKIEPDFVERLFSKKSNLVPDHLQETVYKILPSTAGVYYFIGKNGKPVYIGKATNIRNRVLSHFRGDGNSLKILSLGAQIKKIVFTETGCELLASLLEDHEIRHFWPRLNRSQKKHIVRFGIVAYMDQKHRWRLNIATSGKMNCFIVFFHQYHLATEFIRAKIMEYQLDATLCGVPDGGTIDPEMHQMNFVKMLDELSAFKNIEVFFDSGRKADEKSYVWLENKVYKGFGYIQSGAEPDEETLLANLTLRQSSITTENIIKKLQETAPPSHTFQNKKPRQLPGLDTSNLIQHQLSYSSSGIA